LTSLDERASTASTRSIPATRRRRRCAAPKLASQLRAALDTLPDRERALLNKHYFEGKNLLDAGRDLGISKSWASRMHAQAVDRLRAALAKAQE
ncbi:MAG: RNA polymerase subunit sigma-70, partial [Myxococcales bacterium]|nr:RNA polymerase subunit sigma-70 [Myxococcales bacterium]